MSERDKQINFSVGPIRFHFSWGQRPKRSPYFFRTRCANFIVFGHPLGFVQIPWFWSHAAIESRGYDKGWRAGYLAGKSRPHE